MKLLYGHDKEVADWASKQFGWPLRNWYFAVGIVDNAGTLCGAASFHDLNGSNGEICFYGPGALRPSLVRELMRFAFDGMKLHRLTAKTPRQNRQVIRALPKLGFRMEGVLKHYYGPVKRYDAVVFGLLEKDARRWIK